MGDGFLGGVERKSVKRGKPASAKKAESGMGPDENLGRT